MSEWIVEAVLQFVNSPLWNVPVNNFIDDKCIVFDQDDDEMKLEYTPVYKEFQELIDGLLSSFVGELGVPAEEVINACRERSAAEAAKSGSRKAPSGIVTVSSFLDYITYLTDFRSFKKLMERRNVELDVEATRALKRISSNAGNVATAPPPSAQELQKQRESDEERDLRLALQMSLHEAELIAKEAELQDAELQRALALSLALEQDRAQRKAEELERQTKLAAAAHAEAERLEQEKQRRLAEIEAERKRKVAELEQQALKERMENLVVHAERAATVSQAVPVPTTTTDVASAPAPAPAADSAPAQVSQPVEPVQDVVRIATQPDVELPQPSSLAPLGRKGTFGAGFKPLPSIQPTFKELNSAMVASTTTSSGVQRPAPLAVAPVITENKDQPTKEEIEERARHMRQQRELLMAQRKATRAAELANYSNGGASTTPSGSPPAVPSEDRQKQMALEIARRFREDIVGEVRRQQNAE